MPKLIIKSGEQEREVAVNKDNFCIGRTPENDLEVKDSLISRRHSYIIKKGDQHIIYDLGSSNGTYVNKERIEMKVLEDGDVVRLGDTEILYRDGKPKTSGEVKKPEVPAEPANEKIPTDFYGTHQVVRHVDDIAESYAFDITDALSKGLSLRDIRKEVGTEKAAQDSKMFFILFQVGKALSTAATLDDMLAISMKLIFEVINAERGVMIMSVPETKELTPRIGYQRSKGVTGGDEIRVSTTIAKQVIGEKVAIITSDALQDPRFMQGLSIIQYNVRSALAVPLWEENRVYGAIYLDNLAKSYAFTKEDLELLTAIANLIAIRIKQDETREKLRKEEMLRTNLSKYHSPDVVTMLVSKGGDVGLEVVEREVTVAFVDVEGSTKLAEEMTPSQIASLLNEFFEMATGAIFRFKGHVNKFIGDEVMAIFNAPLDMPDHALAAVKTCVTILKELERHNGQHPDRPYNLRIGINTGTTVAGNVGTQTRMEYTVLGDTVNTAKRLCGFPQVNKIIIGENTYERVKNVFQAKDLGETLLKGKEKTLRAYEIIL